MIRLERDPNFINRIANSPGVQPFIRPDGAEMDWAPAVAHRPSVSGIVVLSNGEDAVAVFEATAIAPPFQAFQTHLLFAVTCRGRRAIDTYRAMLAWMAERGATLIWGSIPRANHKARWFGRQMGFAVSGGDDRHEYLQASLI